MIGAYIDGNNLKFKNFEELKESYEAYEICENNFPDIKFKNTNMFSRDEGIYYLQYKFEEKVSFKLINTVLKHFRNINKK